MMRQVSSRNQRSKGLRVKNVLRWYLLAAACLWLLYQLKHSYDKKRAPEERNLEASEKMVGSQPVVLKFGRKDLPLGEENGSGNDTHDKEEDNQEAEGEEEDQEIKQAIEDEEAGGDGDDEINEQDQERTDEQEDQERADEEAENGEELTNEEDKDGQGEETEQFDDRDTEEDSFNEAREESYKRDDESGVVLQEYQAKNSEDEDGDAGEDTDDRAGGADDSSEADSDLSVGAADASKDNVIGVVFAGNETNHNDHRTMNGTVIERKGSEIGLNISEGSLTSNQIELHSNSTTASVINYHIEAQANSTSDVSSNQIETQTNSAVIDAVADSVPLQNETVGRVSVQNHNITIEMENSEQDKASFKNAVMEGLVERSNRTVGQEDAGEHSFVSLGAIDKRDVIHDELAESSHKMVTEEERNARTDLSTLPAMQNEVKVMVGKAAE